jgi:hypothetical protein
MENIVFKKLAEKWPSSLVARTEIEKFTGGILKEKYCANLDSAGIGIEGRIRINNRKIAYPVDAVIAYLERRAEVVKPKKREAAL